MLSFNLHLNEAREWLSRWVGDGLGEGGGGGAGGMWVCLWACIRGVDRALMEMWPAPEHTAGTSSRHQQQAGLSPWPACLLPSLTGFLRLFPFFFFSLCVNVRSTVIPSRLEIDLRIW